MGLRVEVDGGNATISGALFPREAFVGEDNGRPSASQTTNALGMRFSVKLTDGTPEVDLAYV